MLRIRIPHFVGLCALVVFSVGASFAQFDTATVSGVVRDPAQAVVTGGKVTLESVSTGVVKTANTDQNGSYTFFDVKIGRYKLKAEAPGFKAAVAEEFTVTVNAHQRVDLQLQIGAVTESVEVVGAASAIETDSSSRGHVIANVAIVNLPLNGRSYADLALLAPGVRKSVLEDGSVTSRDASFNVNGQRSALNNFMVDGVDNNAYGTSNQGFSSQVVQLTPDAVSEFRVETSNYSAEYGRAAGAVINAATKSGTNAIHGSAWEYLRNTNLNAVGFFKPVNNVKPVYIQNQFGATFGGPIKRDKLFYFLDFEGQRRIQRVLTFATVPTADQKAGRFNTPIRNPLTGAIYSDGNLPANQVTGFRESRAGRAPAAESGRHQQQLPVAAPLHHQRQQGQRPRRLLLHGSHHGLLPLQPSPGPDLCARQHSGSRGRQQQRRRAHSQQADQPRRHLDRHSDHDGGSPPGRHLDRGRQEPHRLGRGQPSRNQRHHRPAHRSAREGRAKLAKRQRLFAVRPPGKQPAVPESVRRQPQDQYRQTARPPHPPYRVRVAAYRHGDRRFQPGLRQRHLQRSVQQDRRRHPR